VFTEIELLESIVQDHLYDCPGKNDDKVSMSAEIKDLVKNTRKALIRNVCELKKDQLIEIYIQDIQKRLINLSNVLFINIESKSNFKGNPKNIETIKELLKIVDILLNFLGVTFLKYLNLEMPVPENQKEETIVNFTIQLIHIEKLFKDQQNELLQIALKPVKKFIETKQAITYNQSDYFNLLLQELSNLDGSLEVCLIESNYNSFLLFHYLIHEIENELDELQSNSGKLDNLFWNLKKLKQIQITAKAYQISRKSIKDLLIDWINEEITYLEKSATLQKQPQARVDASLEKTFKLITDLSVPQLGFLIRLFLDSGLFKNKSYRAVAAFFAQHTKTKGSAAISPGNLANKFYDVTGNVEEVVKGILFKMLNQIQKY
jgi:hypothetical protein